MKSSIEKLEGLERKLTIEVPADKIASAFDQAYKGIQKNANIKGFRKGKAPLNVIKKLYADRVQQDVLQDVVSDSYTTALDEHDLNPLTQPNVHFAGKLQEGSPFSYTAQFEVRPEVALKKYEGLSVEKQKLIIQEAQVESVLKNLRESRTTNTPILEDRTAQEGDIAEVDFKGTVDGQPLEGGQAENYQLELGSKSFIPGFEEGVVGMKVGSNKRIDIKFPDDYGHKDLAGKPVSFEVTLKKLNKKTLPELNDEFAKSVGGFENMDELKKAIEKDLTAQETKRINDDLKAQVLKALAKENPVEIPQALKASQKEALIQDVEKRMKDQGMTPDQFQEYKIKWDKEFDETAEFMIQSNMLVDKIASDQNLGASQKDIETKLDEYSKQTGIELKKIQDFYSDQGRLSQLHYQITEERVVEFLISKASVTEVEPEKKPQE